MTVHEVKCDPHMFARLLDGSKTFEVRKDDRGYQTGDELVIREHDSERCRAYKGHGNGKRPECLADTGRVQRFRIGFVFKQGYGVDLGKFVVLSLLPVERAK